MIADAVCYVGRNDNPSFSKPMAPRFCERFLPQFCQLDRSHYIPLRTRYGRRLDRRALTRFDMSPPLHTIRIQHALLSRNTSIILSLRYVRWRLNHTTHIWMLLRKVLVRPLSLIHVMTICLCRRGCANSTKQRLHLTQCERDDKSDAACPRIRARG